MTGESVAICAIEIDGKNYPEIPENHQEECEDIEVFRVPVDQLEEFVRLQEEAGCGVDSKLHTFIAMRKLGW